MNNLKSPSFVVIFLMLMLSSGVFTSFQHQANLQPVSLSNKSSQLFAKIDSQLLTTVEEIGGGIYYPEIDAIVPFFPSLVKAEWLIYKNTIAEKIGLIAPGPSQKSNLWKNSAATMDQLLIDAKQAAPYFWKMSLDIAQKTGCFASFGIDNRHVIKSKRSIQRKIQESMKMGLSEKESIHRIRDTVRGTIIAESTEQIPCIIQALKESAFALGREFIFINMWANERPSGYVGIHAKMLLPIYDAQGMFINRDIIVEMQIHLKCIMDGSKGCSKERAHLLYHHMRILGVDPDTQTSASMLLYLTGLKQYSG